LSNGERNERDGPPEYDEHGIPILNVRARLSEVERKATEAETRDQNYKNRQEMINLWLMIFTGLLVLTSLISGGIAIWQARIANQSAKAAQSAAHTAATVLEEAQKPTSDVHISAIAAQNAAIEAQRANDFARDALIRVQRAFVIVNPNKILMQASRDIGKEEMHFFLPMENSGTTPTRNLTGHINRAFGAEMPKNFTYPDASEPGSRDDLTPVIGPRDSYPLEAIVSRQQYEMWQRHEAHLYIYGWVEYNDIFDKTPRHITRFCYEAIPVERIRLAGGQEAGGLQLMTRGTFFNCYDEECKPRKGH
jgi:hypothetical protein